MVSTMDYYLCFVPDLLMGTPVSLYRTALAWSVSGHGLAKVNLAWLCGVAAEGKAALTSREC